MTSTFEFYPPIGYQTFRGFWKSQHQKSDTKRFVFFGKVDRAKIKVFDRSTFPKTTKRLVPDGWVEPKSSDDRCHFWTFQLELDILGTKNIGNGSVVAKLQPLEVGRISKISENPSSARPSDDMGKLYG